MQRRNGRFASRNFHTVINSPIVHVTLNHALLVYEYVHVTNFEPRYAEKSDAFIVYGNSIYGI